MKTTKKIFAALLTVMMVLMMVPFSASAATTGDFTINAAPQGFTLSVFKIATLEDEASGKYTSTISAVNDFINGSKSATELNQALDALVGTKTAAQAATALGTSVVATVSDSAATTVKAGAGLFYIKPCSDGVPATYTKAAGSVVAAPEYSTASKTFVPKSAVTINSTKASSSTVEVHKTIVADQNYLTSTPASDGIIYGAVSNAATPVNFKLTGTNVGSKDEPVKSYIIADIMDENLTFDASSVKVYVVAGANKTQLGAADYTVKQSETIDGTAYTFVVELAQSVIGATTATKFYNAGATVEVTYQATVKDNAPVATALNNTDYLLYKNASAQASAPYTKETGETVKVYTLAVAVQKMDASKGTRLAGATLGLFKGADQVATVVTTKDGDFDVFKKADGSNFTAKAGESFTIKELIAPNGFVLSTEEVAVTVNAALKADGSLDMSNTTDCTDGTFFKTFNNRPVVVPATGGAGTIAFTIVGISLIVVAGVLFLVVRKRSAK